MTYYKTREDEIRATLTRDQCIDRILAYGAKVDVSSEMDVWDQLLACEALVESGKGGEIDMAKTDDWQEVESTIGDTWDYKVDKEVTGVLVEKRSEVGPNLSMMYTLEQPDHTQIGVWGSNVLDGKMKAVEIGEEVRIVYKGMAKSEKTKRSYHDFTVFHRPVPMKEV